MSDDLSNKLRQELSRAFMNNEGINEIKKRVSSVFDSSEARAESIARTEFNRASNQGKLLAYKQAEVDYGIEGKKKWISKFDHRTSEVCKRLDGQTVPLDEDFNDPAGTWKGQAPPSHVNCRSTWSFIPK